MRGRAMCIIPVLPTVESAVEKIPGFSLFPAAMKETASVSERIEYLSCLVRPE